VCAIARQAQWDHTSSQRQFSPIPFDLFHLTFFVACFPRCPPTALADIALPRTTAATPMPTKHKTNQQTNNAQSITVNDGKKNKEKKNLERNTRHSSKLSLSYSRSCSFSSPPTPPPPLSPSFSSSPPRLLLASSASASASSFFSSSSATATV
jgi:hypothetical protein